MESKQITEDELIEISYLREKVAVVLSCIIDDLNAREQTLTYIASDYLSTMGEMIEAMQKNLN